MEFGAELNALTYGDFVPFKKKNVSQKIEEVHGAFVRVRPKSLIKAQAEAAAPKFSSDVNDFVLEEPDTYVPRRLDEISRFLADDKKSLKIEKSAVKLLQKYDVLEQKKLERAARIRRPIGVKLLIIISFLLVVAVGCVTSAVSYFVTQDTRSNAEENNLAINSRTASDTENRINSAVSSVTMFLDLISTARDSEERLNVENLYFNRHKDIVAVYFSRNIKSSLFTNETFLVTNEIEKSSVLSYMQQETEAEEKAKSGIFEILNASPFFNVPMISLFCPVVSDEGGEFVAFLYSTTEIGESFASGSINQSFFVNNDGIILVHGDLEKMKTGADESSSKIVQEMLSSRADNGQIPYRDENGDEFIGAFRKLGIGNGGIITIVKTSVILEGVKRITIRNIYIMFAVLALAFLIVYFFAKSLSTPLRRLTSIVNEVNNGNFNTELFDELKLNRKDEIGVLEKSTKNEREILNMVSRLTNKGVTKAVIKKEIDFEPHLKDITVFFSDIRGFTAISDGFKNRFGEHSAAEIIGFLNDYMSRMVTCINKTGGIVDKFEGDAIMAAWGVLRNDNLEWEKMGENSVTRILKEDAHREYVKADALSAVTCCIAMRYSLMKYNKDANAFTEAHRHDPLAKYKPNIRIGAGLNSGRATVGFMGSFDKMEFTSIGDSVNFASRAEASNKPCGTDILITQDTYDILKKDYIRCEENNFIIRPANIRNEIVVEKIPVEFEVKGKGKQHFYGVVNMPNFDVAEFFSTEKEDFEVDEDCERTVGPAGPKSLKELRELLGIETPDFEKVNLDAEENKIQVAAP
ncbi:adenylate/guanylate cyclase domain-containing protein [uncultured Treponema sp.]|uniref:adenylate/guanylate cyclase domain-containing protein n=1 Tax=uncultured Treponema sp. TaxID=162155 RepID=UPI0025DE4103|nr:adenylate/guanylate cyclase domain-containing protein [uncultured Treponema sp.]